jgi:amino-acid N-acetyltransferase
LLLMWIERAEPSDLPAVKELLSAAGLPLDGVAGALALGVVARDDNAVIGAAGVECFGGAGLLRSVVVVPGRRGTGVGRALVTAAEGLARDERVRELYLLTETAVDWFLRIGYETVARDAAASVVGGSVEFTTACADTAIAMRRTLA